MTATVTLSIEVELGWGVHDLEGDDHLSEDGAAERRYLSRLLDACDAHGVPITFDVVGHLLLSSCSGHHEGPYPDGWFDADPGTDASKDPLFYAPRAVEDIRQRRTDHELCTHTFSHLPADGVDGVDDDALTADLDRAQRLHRSRFDGASPSLVPPRHYSPSAEVLSEAEIEVIREAVRAEADGVERFVDLLVGLPPMSDPTVEDGVAVTRCSSAPSLTAASLPSGQRSAHPAFRWLPVAARRRIHRYYLDRTLRTAIERDAHVHLWCHLYDLANEHQFSPLRRFVERLGTLRRRGEVDVLTMAELNDRVRADREETSESTPSAEDVPAPVGDD